MSFLDDLVSVNTFNANLDEGLIIKLESLIWNSSLDEKEKAKQMKHILQMDSTEEAYALIKKLEEYQPVPGRDRIAITQYEIVGATRRAVEMDDFKERKK